MTGAVVHMLHDSSQAAAEITSVTNNFTKGHSPLLPQGLFSLGKWLPRTLFKNVSSGT